MEYVDIVYNQSNSNWRDLRGDDPKYDFKVLRGKEIHNSTLKTTVDKIIHFVMSLFYDFEREYYELGDKDVIEKAQLLEKNKQELKKISPEAHQSEYPAVKRAIQKITENCNNSVDPKIIAKQIINLKNLVAAESLLSEEEKAFLSTLPLDIHLSGSEKKPEEFAQQIKKHIAQYKSSFLNEISVTAGLFGTIRKIEQLNGSKFSENQGHVYQFTSSNNVIGFFKVVSSQETSKRYESSLGFMETLAWGTANIFGVAGYFAPTRQMEKDEKKGTFQPASGMTLDAFYNGNNPLSQLTPFNVSNGIFLSVVFGMFDAHRANILVNEANEIIFFDNTRSMPNSNGYIIRAIDDSGEYGIYSAYKCSLLDDPASKTPLNPQEIDYFKKEVKEMKEKMGMLERYWKSMEGKMNNFPPGWMDDKKAPLKAMRQRLDALELAFDKGQIKTGQDLVFHANPDYRFIYALGYLINHKLSHGKAGIQNIFNLLDWHQNGKYNMKKVYALCNDPSVTSFDDLKKKLRYCWGSSSKSDIEEIKNEIRNKAAFDFKDWSQKVCYEYALAQADIPLLAAEDIYSLGKMGVAMENTSLFFFYNRKGITTKVPISIPNMNEIIIDGKTIPIGKFRSYIKKRSTTS